MLRESLAGALFFAASAAPAAASGFEQTSGRMIQIGDGLLVEALVILARQAGAEILYDVRIVRGIRSRRVTGRMSVASALDRLLASSGISYRRTADGAFVLFREGLGTRPLENEPAPEILVVGRRTQNSDIRRTRNDIQPYVVSGRREIENAHSDNVGDFMRSRVSANAQTVAPEQDTLARPGAVQSEIDLRGLGSLRTLVLVDGRRMPSLPTPQRDFGQGDLNAVPLRAIERIETLTGTSGGIHGPGAIGGVVNVVLRRDYRGAELHLVSDLSARGDAKRFGVEARLGFTPNGGRTDVMLYGARSWVSPLLAGQRDYAVRVRQQQFQNDPAAYIAQQQASSSITAFSEDGNLRFDPEFGGGVLDAPYTFLPIGFTGTTAERIALLTANAGKLPVELPPDIGGSRKYVVSRPVATSAIANVRHRFSAGLEAYVDLLYFRNDGRFEGENNIQIWASLPDAANNPFQQPVTFQFPKSFLTTLTTRKLAASRATLGLVWDGGSGWKAAADLTLGRSRISQWSQGEVLSIDHRNALREGTVGADGLPILDPLRDWNAFVAASARYIDTVGLAVAQINHMSAAAVRLAGPVLRLGGGPLGVTLLAERRREHVPGSVFTFQFNSAMGKFSLPVRTQSTTSGYAELRAPVGAGNASFPLLRGLEFQLALRYDRTITKVPEDFTPAQPSNDRLVAAKSSGLTYTAGARLFPISTVMVRASIATGELPPTIEQLGTVISRYDSIAPGLPDPARGNRRIGSEGTALFLQQGSMDVEPERATTLSVGAVLNPTGDRLPRLSVDYSRIDKRREIQFFPPDVLQILRDEARLPGRVVRAPLSDADRALGFTAGPISKIDARAYNGGQTIVEAVDVQFDWTVPTGSTGELRFHGGATWSPTFRKRSSATGVWVDHIGYRDGPLAWRGNFGAEWSKGPLTMGMSAQYFDRYRAIYTVDGLATSNAQILRYQGSAWIRSQTYLDFAIRRRFELGGRGALDLLDVSFGIQNLLDSRPPLTAHFESPGYSFYGDPRRRRFHLVVTAGL